ERRSPGAAAPLSALCAASDQTPARSPPSDPAPPPLGAAASSCPRRSAPPAPPRARQGCPPCSLAAPISVHSAYPAPPSPPRCSCGFLVFFLDLLKRRLKERQHALAVQPGLMRAVQPPLQTAPQCRVACQRHVRQCPLHKRPLSWSAGNQPFALQ